MSCRSVFVWVWCVLLLLALSVSGCGRKQEKLEPRSLTWAELRAVRSGVRVEAPGEREREPYPAERLADGARVHVAEGGLAWLRRDAGTTLLVRGPATLTLRARSVELAHGRVFVDAPSATAHELRTPAGPLTLGRIRASIDVANGGATRVYVLAGELEVGAALARAGEELVLPSSGAPSVAPVSVWEDWTGGLATTDRSPAPAPFGVGTVGARTPGTDGAPRFPLAIERMDVRVSIEGDFAVSEIDQTFFNPSSETVEGMFAFRTPPRAVFQRFGVDRDGVLVWGHVKERAAAKAEYQEKVYEGSTEDPALLEWDAAGSYRARLYPIGPGGTRRVVVRYAEWLERSGPKRERRVYVFPMAAEGTEASLPRIEELKLSLDLARAGAKEVRSGMAGVRDGHLLVVRAHDHVPRADLTVELFDDGLETERAYRAPHRPDLQTLPAAERPGAEQRAKGEADYLLVPVRAADVPRPAGGLDLVMVVDTSAATDRASLSTARAVARALLAHLGPSDRAVVLAGDASLRPVVPGWASLQAVDAAARERVLRALATLERGGATDLGALLTAGAELIDPKRRGALVYVGDGVATVGELSLEPLRERLSRAPRAVRLFALGVGESANLGLLTGLARGGFAERVSDGYGAARAALRVLEGAERPALLGVEIDLGPGVERIFPRESSALLADETLWLVGRLSGDSIPKSVRLKSAAGTSQRELAVSRVDDGGDLARRWAEQRLFQMLSSGEGHAALVDLGVRNGIVTPVTSLYVPVLAEMAQADRDAFEQQRERSARAASPKDAKEGGTGTATAAAASDARRRDTDLEALQQELSPASAPAPPPAAPDPEKAKALLESETASAPGVGQGRMAKPAKRQSAGHGRLGGSHAGDLRAGSAGGALRAGEVATGARGLGLSGGGALGAVGSGGGGLGLLVTSPTGKARPAANEARLTLLSKPAGFGEVHGLRVVIQLPREALGCSGAADAPIGERVRLWRERLSASGGDPQRLTQIYRRALADCEASSAWERARLLSLMLDAAGQVDSQVALYRLLFSDVGAADVLYAGILARIKTPEQRAAFYAALGVKSVDPGYLERLLAALATPVARVEKLRELERVWPDDLRVLLALLDALEDARDEPSVRELARRLRARGDADAAVRTAVGELYLRLAAGNADDGRKRELLAEARRAFGEIVEFAPEDPRARRHLGDLLSSHGWHAEARRQYETLAALTPDETSVALLLARAAQGQGLFDEAFKWTEKGGAAGAPDALEGLAVTARALSLTYLAWARAAAQSAGRDDQVRALRARAERALSAVRDRPNPKEFARVALTWTHPELHPSLWTYAGNVALPAREGDRMLGIAHTSVAARDGEKLEVRVEPADFAHAARLGATAELTAVFDELGANERIVRVPLRFEPGRGPVIRLSIANGEVRRD